jgi:nicotinamide riboside kinase
MAKSMEGGNMNRVFFITGAESTGKSTLTTALAEHFGGIGIPEYARTYLESIHRHYEYSDVEAIARRQIALIHENTGPIVFFDTCLIILKIWFREVYNEVPDWLLKEIPLAGKGIYLLCEPDLPWLYDPLRENPYRREYLSQQYEIEIKAAGFTYFRVSGQGEERVKNAIEIINKVFKSGFGQK